MVYEQTDGNGIQQIFLQRLDDEDQAPILVSADSNQNGGNSNSFVLASVPTDQQ